MTLAIKPNLTHLTRSFSSGDPYIVLTYVSFRLLYASRLPCHRRSCISWCRAIVSMLTVRLHPDCLKGFELLIAVYTDKEKCKLRHNVFVKSCNRKAFRRVFFREIVPESRNRCYGDNCSRCTSNISGVCCNPSWRPS